MPDIDAAFLRDGGVFLHHLSALMAKTAPSCYRTSMNTTLRDVIADAEQLPETDQAELAVEIEDMIVRRKIAAGEASYAEHGGVPLAEAFDRLEKRYGG